MTNTPTNNQDVELDRILKRLIADVDDNMEFLGTAFNPKDRASAKVNASLDKAKKALAALIHEKQVEAKITVLEKIGKYYQDEPYQQKAREKLSIALWNELSILKTELATPKEQDKQEK